MRGCISAVIFCLFFKANLSAVKHKLTYLNTVEDNFQMPCDTNNTCKDIGFVGFQCINNICVCESDKLCKKPSLKKTVMELEESCVDSSECHIEQSFCNKIGKCDCIENTVAAMDKRRCLNISFSLHSPCEQDSQCVPLNGACKNQRCNCSSDMHPDKGICFKSVDLGFSCTRDEQCSAVDFSSCQSGVCVCNKKYVKSSTQSKCLLKSKFLSDCVEDVQCMAMLGPGSGCFNNFCKCDELHQYKSKINKCVIDFFLGELCGTHGDCHQPGAEKSRLECVLGVCKCKPAYVEENGYCTLNSAGNAVKFSLQNLLPYIISYTAFYIVI